ncbi:hypothetical protein EMIHUDRAFT_202179 [Emiliania huxleyi CCMP1516]|uniref:BTB domain-containing protein n=2 Tax=Emiliania huxleyi TaxID=2903 RepID=A0A0D3KF64_EMIH1|nr:hypothetical protein EMIHUDRAFT_202179 [Emiliania huxleyi CCMP1516]EOD34399.1 hypothetical protein EMIHUDRAFT_202179 [Emiliania huxleyi CCMP1516]|eukprot:XP_005786828.1 hypothetical protein EMIHUDRAFT_202179 [Emiliania huxleyi CCMP1516]
MPVASVEQPWRRACAAGLTDSRAPQASRSTRGTTCPARRSAQQEYCDMLHNAKDSTEKLAPVAHQHVSAPGGHPASRSFVQRSERAAPHQADPWRALSQPRGGGRPSEREPRGRPCPAHRRASGTKECKSRMLLRNGSRFFEAIFLGRRSADVRRHSGHGHGSQ